MLIGVRKESIISTNTNVWDKVAKDFGKHGPDYWAWFGKKLVEHSDLKLGQKVLDIGCGRGASLFPAVNEIGLDGSATGLDTSEMMIRHTQEEVDELGLSNIRLVCSDLENFNSEENSFDYIQCGFGLGFIHINKNYRLIHKLLKTDGVFALTSWTQQEDQDWITGLVNKYLNIETKEKKISPLSTEKGIIEILESEGFKDIKIKTLSKYFAFNTDVLSAQEPLWTEALYY
ncbi:methyltransferase domain-containing protein [Acidaminobacter sp. JC074]|uniref:class I SAM-dependent methyltransferase n=1 Tax=Acidaminobacter sp. JC074 TaxID=2530199 RepID=UPI001F105CFE|nr:methyltransferase domain-containing protein [Acidaminobacter sp. JC074]MCH4887105.1 methyltransferase domain-containing protein [Acidaminobacter sp. JC074]